MNWFSILKNEMRSVNLPKFKVKPFNVNKPDEEDNDCERQVKEIEKKFYDRQFFNQSELNSLVEKVKNPYFDVSATIKEDSKPHRHKLVIQYIPKPELYPNYTGRDYFRIRVLIDNSTWAETFIESNIKTFGETKISEEDYCRILDTIQRDVQFKSQDGDIWYYTENNLTAQNDNNGTFDVRGNQFKASESFDRVRGLRYKKDNIVVRMDCELDVDVFYNKNASDMSKNNYTFKQAVIRDGLDVIAEYLNNINIKFTE